MHRTVALSIMLTFAAYSAAYARVVRVPADRPTIQSGVDFAAGGDTVLVAPGTYFENVFTYGQPIVLRSEQGPAATIIDGSQPTDPNRGSVILIQGSGTVIEGFTIRGGSGSLFDSSIHTAGGGVAFRVGGVTIQNNWITENEAEGGAGIYAGTLGTFLVRGNRIYSNTADKGGAFLNVGDGPGIVEQNEVFDNTATIGAGIICVPAYFLIVRNNVIACNQGSGIGAAHDILNNTIVNNTGPGIVDYWASRLHGNNITHNGLGVYCDDPPGSCNNFFANGEEDSSCFAPGGENISVDPLYGDTDCEAFCLAPDSPLLPEHSPFNCGLIGARGICATLAIDPVTSPDYASSSIRATPNPSRASTSLSFELAERRHVVLRLYDVSGRVVRELFSGTLNAGRHAIVWDGKGQNHQNLPSGAYIAELRSPQARYCQKVLLMR